MREVADEYIKTNILNDMKDGKDMLLYCFYLFFGTTDVLRRPYNLLYNRKFNCGPGGVSVENEKQRNLMTYEKESKNQY